MKTFIVTPTPKLESSLDFYLRLRFQRIAHPERCLVTDGKALIEINPERTTRAGIAIYSDSWEQVANSLSKLTRVTEIPGGFNLGDPNGVRIHLRQGSPPEVPPRVEKSFSTLGGYAGLSLECSDLERTIAVWETLGFQHSCGDLAQGWASYSNEEGFGVSLMAPGMCPHLVFNPSLTYFNGGKNLPVIEAIRAAGIPLTEEITHFNDQGIVDNVIIRDPGGYGFYVFND